MHRLLHRVPEPVPEAPTGREESHQPKWHSGLHKERGLKPRALQPTTSSGGPDLRRALGGKQKLLSGAAIKSTISDNRTGNSQARFLIALDKSSGKSLLDSGSPIPSSDSAGIQPPESSVNTVVSRTGSTRSAAIAALTQNNYDVGNAIWHLLQPAPIANYFWRSDTPLDPAVKYNKALEAAATLNEETAKIPRSAEIHSHLIEQATNLGIDISGDSIQSTIFQTLLLEISGLEEQRATGNHLHEFRDPQSKNLQTPANAGPFRLELYNDSPQSAFYSRLLDIRNKLQYEIDALARLGRLTENPNSTRVRIVAASRSEPSYREPYRESLGSYSSENSRDDGNGSRGSRGNRGNRRVVDEGSDDNNNRRSMAIVRHRRPVDIDDSDSDETEPPFEDDENTPCWLLAHTATTVASDSESEDEEFGKTLHAEIFGPKGCSPIKNPPGVRHIVRNNPRISFVIERQFHRGTFLRQTVNVISDSLKKFLSVYKPGANSAPSSFNWDMNLVLFHHRQEIEKATEDLKDDEQVQVEQLLEATREDHEEATALFKRGLVTLVHLRKLFFCHTVLVSSGEPVETFRCGRQPLRFNHARGTLSVEVFHWLYDGKFHLASDLMIIRAPQGPIEIKSLKAYPLQYASPEIQQLVAARSKTYWMCRQRSFVSYCATDHIQRTQGPSNHRFMIDYDTYRELHPDADEFTDDLIDSADPMGEEEMMRDEPPGNGLELVFPSKISGFSIQDKKWKTLLVDYIRPVTWNTVAFDRLVLKPVAKELIQAVVQVHNNKERSADLMQGKGNGSLILLHGPPGTGKTLTAESVAELVQRPLYRVTCGDVGTDPESVENYLEAVLYIGKIWGCVVLLDEADVFLEERTLTDLHRNALVSVFLRVLEYYDGILILTSNRVGTFDEAFKSRIKLALHYTSLGKADRRKVWRNFFKTLKETDPEYVDFEDLDDHLDDLANIELNGRDIRNAISVARELAQFRKGEKMNYEHIRHVISIGEEFEKYLDKTHGHTTSDWLKENGIRA
ncbi:proteasome-activating nucleotidase [Trichoderma arundinaceum]|uniref:Proteasome-activating nucleotidase n=1 Tax=Trichoderma arundinaceum TaxID=490622 RepID=A0A395NA58_TRIAR|nr:proteasome-activating nucleotidase [Trichoderma arundinaceum]